MDEKKCAVCAQKAPASCSNCFKVAYCSVEHQEQHWNVHVHKKDCSYFKILEDPEFPELGKGFVATRDIKAGTIILEESPLVFASTAEQPACIACGFNFTWGKPGEKCGECQWPVCCVKCSQVAVHADNECKLFVSKGFKLTDMPEILTVGNVMDVFVAMVRTLLLKKSGSDIYEKILELKSEHSIPGFHAIEERYLKSIKHILASIDLSVEDDEFLRLFNIFHINSFISSVPYGDSRCSMSTLYFKASRLNHSCIPNCDWRISQPPGSQLRIRTTVSVKKGEPLTTAYSVKTSIGPTKMRQMTNLRAGFQCKCKRCLDPTELGTYLSAVVCSSCRSKSSQLGYFLPENPLNLSDDSNWKCNCCGSSKPASVLLPPIEKAHKTIISKLRTYIESQKGEALIKFCKRVEDKYSGKSLHPNHFLIKACIGAVIDYFSIPERTVTLDLGTNAYVIKCGYHLMAIYDVVLPGCSFPRAMLQRQIASALELQEYLRGRSVSDEQLESLDEALELYKESLKYFEGDFLRNDGVKSEVNKVRSSIQCIENTLMVFCMSRMSSI